jgi:hypothetical protein
LITCKTQLEKQFHRHDLASVVHFKTFFMENTVQQEILLMTNSSLSKRSLCDKNNSEGKLFSTTEQLEQACWNGMLDEFLPGLVLTIKGKTLFLWEVQNANNFLHIDLCDQIPSLNKDSSIDPYIFLNHLHYN